MSITASPTTDSCQTWCITRSQCVCQPLLPLATLITLWLVFPEEYPWTGLDLSTQLPGRSQASHTVQVVPYSPIDHSVDHSIDQSYKMNRSGCLMLLCSIQCSMALYVKADIKEGETGQSGFCLFENKVMEQLLDSSISSSSCRGLQPLARTKGHFGPSSTNQYIEC